MKFKSLGILLFAGAMVSAGSCTNEGRKEMGQDMKDEAGRVNERTTAAVDEAAAKLKIERDELSARIDRSMESIAMEIDDMDKKMERATAKEKANWKVRRAKLSAQQEELKGDLAELKSDTKREWGEFKTNVSNAIDEIEKDLKDN